MARKRSMARGWCVVQSVIVFALKRARTSLGTLASRAAPQQLRSDNRGSVAGYGLLVLAVVVVVGAAVFIGLNGGVLDGDTGGSDVEDSGPAADTDPTPVEEGNESDDSTGSDDDDDTTEEDDTGGDDDGTDDNDSDGSNDSDDSDDSSDDSEDEESDSGPDRVSLPVEVYALNIGPADAGNMTIRRQNDSAVVATHNFSRQGSKGTFEGLIESEGYELEVNVPYYPPETQRFVPQFWHDSINKTVGYEMPDGAESYEIQWQVNQLPVSLNASDPNAEEEAIPLYGTSTLDEQGNYYSRWDDPGIPGMTQYYYNASVDETFKSGAGYDWSTDTGADFSERSSARDSIALEGLKGVEKRVYVGERRAFDPDHDEIHLYNISTDVFGQPVTVGVYPDTGEVTTYRARVEKMPEAGATKAIAEFEAVNQNVSTSPEDFPEELLEEASK